MRCYVRRNNFHHVTRGIERLNVTEKRGAVVKIFGFEAARKIFGFKAVDGHLK
jgi:hypothetical protein